MTKPCIQDLLTMYSTPDVTTGCILWTGRTRKKGYGVMQVAGKALSSHRVAYELEYGPIPEGLHILHKCDTPACINPLHLFAGTNAENIKDKQAKGRQPKGEEVGGSFLKEDQIREIKILLDTIWPHILPELHKENGKIRTTWLT